MDEQNTPQITSDFLTPEQFAGVQEAQRLVARGNEAPITPVQETAITPESLENVTPINVPTIPPTTPTPVTDTTALVDAQIAEAERAQQETAEQRRVEEASLGIADLLEETTGRSQFRTQLEQASPLSDFRKEALGIRNKILELSAEINKSDIELIKNQRDEEVRDTLLPFARSNQAKLAGDAAILRGLKNAEIGVLNARLLGTQGNIALAQDEIDRAVDAKYAPYEEQIAVYKGQIEALLPIVQGQEKKQAEARQRATELADRKIQDEKEKEKQLQTLKLQAAELGATQNEINNLPNNVDDAIAKLAPVFAKRNNAITNLSDGRTALVNTLTGEVIKTISTKPVDGEINTTKNYAVSKDATDSVYSGKISNQIGDIINSSGFKKTQSMTDILGVLVSVETLVEKNKDGNFPGLAPVRLPSKLSSKRALQNKQGVEAINLKVQQWASGAALTEEQTKQVERLTPRKGDTDKQAKAKINGLADYMLGQVKSELVGQGINFDFEETDYFKSNLPVNQDPLEVGVTKENTDPLSLGI